MERTGVGFAETGLVLREGKVQVRTECANEELDERTKGSCSFWAG